MKPSGNNNKNAQEMFEATQEVIRSSTSKKDMQCNGQKTKRRNNGLQNITQKTKD